MSENHLDASGGSSTQQTILDLGIAMSENHLDARLQCSSCGSEQNLRRQLVACGAMTCWAPRQSSSSPMPIDVAFDAFAAAGRWQHDDLVVWQLALCEECLRPALQHHLRNRIERAKPWVQYGWIALLAFIILGLLDLEFNLVVGLIGFLLFAVGGIFFPVLTVDLLLARYKLRKSVQGKLLDISGAFQGHAESILADCHQSAMDDSVLTLPRYTNSPREKELQGMVIRKQQRLVLAVAESVKQIRHGLPHEWRKVFDRKGLGS